MTLARLLMAAALLLLAAAPSHATSLAAGEVALVAHFNHGPGCSPEARAESAPGDGCFDGETGAPTVSCRRDRMNCASAQMVVSDLRRREAGGCIYHTFTWVCSDVYRTACGDTNACEPLATCANATLGLCTCAGNLTLVVGDACGCAPDFFVAHSGDPMRAACMPVTPACPPGGAEVKPPTATSDRACRDGDGDGDGDNLGWMIATIVLLALLLIGLIAAILKCAGGGRVGPDGGASVC